MNKFLALSFASLMAFASSADSLSNYGVIDYVKSTRTQWLVTDYYPNPKTWMEAVVGFSGTYRRIVTGETSNFFCSTADANYNCYSLNIGDSTTAAEQTTIYAYFYKGSKGDVANPYGKHNYNSSLTATTNTLVAQNGAVNSSVTWGGVAMTTKLPLEKTTTCANPLAIFGRDGAPFGHYDFSVCSVKIYESDDGTKGGANEVLKHDFIPVTNNLGVAGLYDRVANKFFSSASGTPLVAGVPMTYYQVASDAKYEANNSFTGGSNWSTDPTASAGSAHTVFSVNDYVVNAGIAMRSSSVNNKTFVGKSLTLIGRFAMGSVSDRTIPNLIAAGPADGSEVSGALSGDIGAWDDSERKLHGAISIPADASLTFSTSGSTTRSIYVDSTISGAGSIYLYAKDISNRSGLTLAGNNSNFTGAIKASPVACTPKAYTLHVSGNFGGTIESLPPVATVSAIKFNYDGLSASQGLVVSSAAVPDALKTKLILYSSTADFTAKNFQLVTFPYGTIVTPSAFTVKHATTASGTATAFTKLGTIGNPDGTISLVANYDFVNSLATSTSRVDSSPFATGGIVWKLGDDYVHIFTNINGVATFQPSSDLTARVLLVAGGGSGGGKDGSAGGGAGGMVTANSVSFPTGTYAVQVGHGAPANTTTEIGVNGDNSSISNATEAVCTIALGGGGGGSKYDSAAAGTGMKGNDGGSGGGAGCYASLGAGEGTDGQGHDGGAYNGAQLSGGGGGAGSVGGDATDSKAGDGGAGLGCDILGFAETFAGGGGGGSRKNTTAGTEGLGKDGGGNGGRGIWGTENLKATDGVHGKGAGGGGSGGGNPDTGIRYGGAGGCGLVVIRYTDPTKVGKVPTVTLSSVTPNNDATATIAWSMTGKDPLTLKAVYGCDSQNLNLTNTFTTTATAGEGSSTLGGLLPGRTYYLKLVAENEYGDSGFMVPVSFAMPEDGPMPTTPPAEMPIVGSKTVKDQTGGTTIDVVATLSQAGTGSSFADCTATVRWGTVNELAQMTSSKSVSVASDGTVTISPDNLGTGTYYGCLEVVNANGNMDRLFFSFSAADTSTYQWKEGVTNGNWKDRDNWTGAPNDWGLGYPTDLATADFTSANCATVHVSGVINCAKMKMEKANATYVFIGDDATAAVYPATANTSGNQNYVTVPSGEELVFDGIKAYLLCGSSSCFRFDGSSKLVVRNGANVDVCRSGSIGTKESLELTGSEARLEVQGTGSRILTSNFKLAASNKATAGGTVVLSGASPSLNVTSVSSGSIFAQCFDATVVCNIPADGWANPVIPSTKLSKFAQGGNNSGSGKIVFTVPKTAPIRGAKDKDNTESAIVSCANGFEVSRITFGSTAKSSDYFYYTLGDDKYVYCTTNAAKLAAIDAPGVALDPQPAVTALKYHHEPPKGMMLILR